MQAKRHLGAKIALAVMLATPTAALAFDARISAGWDHFKECWVWMWAGAPEHAQYCSPQRAFPPMGEDDDDNNVPVVISSSSVSEPPSSVESSFESSVTSTPAT